MIYFVEIQANKIVSKGFGPAKTSEQIEVTEEIYNQLIRLPADFETDAEGNIISVTPVPESEPPVRSPSIEQRLTAVELALLDIASI